MANASPTTPVPCISDHTLLRCVGKGSYGEVWLAKNVIGAYRAIKIIYRKTFSEDRPFEREFEGIQKFEPISRTHPGLVAILHIGIDRNARCFYYVMEVADDLQSGQVINLETYAAKTLSSEIVRCGRIPFDESLQISLSLTSALGHLHQHGLIHRDIKPSNIIFVNGSAKFADIGLVTKVGDAVTFVGSPQYMPPEDPGNPTADIYSLGKVFYGLFTGNSCDQFPELPSQLEHLVKIPAWRQINAIILKACEPDHRMRFQTATELHEALKALGPHCPMVRQSPISQESGIPRQSTVSGNSADKPGDRSVHCVAIA